MQTGSIYAAGMRILIVGAAAVALLAGCSSGGKTAAPSTSTRVVPAYRAAVGADAAEIATHIKGCSGIRAGSVGAGGRALSSTASCTLAGHVVVIDSWTVASAAVLSAELVDAPTWYAHGSAWCAFLADPGQSAAKSVLQMQLTNDAAGLLDEAYHPVRPASQPAQKSAAAVVAKDLSGQATFVR